MSETPKDKTCSKCGGILHPQVHGYSVDSNFNTVKHYMYGHHCPQLIRDYDNRIKEIQNSSMTSEQKANARMMAGYMNAWGS